MKVLLLILLLPIQLYSQNLHGVWTGTIYNDTTKQYIPYEIAITENSGRLSGFSHTSFTENNKEVVGIKSLRIRKKRDKILIEDDVLLYNNYTEPPPKGVKQYSVLNFTSGPEGEYLIGVFNTNQTKEYASLTGTIRLQKKQNITETKLIPKLEELQLATAASFITTRPPEVAIAKVKKENTTVIEKKENIISLSEDTVDYKVDIALQDDINKSKKKKVIENKPPLKPKALNDNRLKSVTQKTDSTQRKKELPVIIAKTETKKPQPVDQKREKIVANIITQPIKSETKKKNNPIVANISSEKNKQSLPAITDNNNTAAITKNTFSTKPVIVSGEVLNRKIETIRTVDFTSDSLTLTLYDNGEVDGDTVSVLLNGKVIMPKEGLTTQPITKTIYITPDLGDSLQLIMYAENLGTIAPNTGLLIIQDGQERYQVRFSGDLQKNSAIILRRKSGK